MRSRKTRPRSDLTSHLDVSDARRERRGELGTRQREFSISSAFSISDAISISISDAKCSGVEGWVCCPRRLELRQAVRFR